jgi:hypothetical protein
MQFVFQQQMLPYTPLLLSQAETKSYALFLNLVVIWKFNFNIAGHYIPEENIKR